MRPTRRQVVTGGGLVVLSAASWGGVRPTAAWEHGQADACLTPDRLLADLRALCARLHPGTSVALADLQIHAASGRLVTIDLGLHLVWSPGERRMPYSASAPDVARALTGLRDRIADDLVALHRPLLRGSPASGETMHGSWT